MVVEGCVYICPSCGEIFYEYDKSIKYCKDCGQKLDWEEIK